MKRIRLILCLMFVLIACSNNPASTTGDLSDETITTTTTTPSPAVRNNLPQLQIIGNKIVNENGEVVVLRGLGPQQVINLATTNFDISWNERYLPRDP